MLFRSLEELNYNDLFFENSKHSNISQSVAMLKDLRYNILYPANNEVRLEKCSVMVYAVNFMGFIFNEGTFISL